MSYQPPENVPSALSWRDHNVNNGPGNFTVNNNNIVQQTTARRIKWHIQGSEEEEAEYEEYGEYRRSDIQLLKMIHHEKRVFDREKGGFAECERSIFMGQVLSGDGKGTIITVEAYEGRDAPENWKKQFSFHATGRSFVGRVNNAHLLALNRSKIPLLIFLGDLVPVAHVLKKVGFVGGFYLYSLAMQWESDERMQELWIDSSRGTICYGPQGPDPDDDIEIFHRLSPEAATPTGDLNLPSTVDLLQEDSFLRFLAGQKSRMVDKMLVELSYVVGHDDEETSESGIELVDEPTVFSALTPEIPIALASANNVWSSSMNSLVGEEVLESGLTRFLLDDSHTRWLSLDMGQTTTGEAWLSQASSFFHSRGISMEEDLSIYKLASRGATLSGWLDKSPVKHERRQLQPLIYLFVHLPSTDLPDGETSFLHFWSFYEDGRNPLSPSKCDTLGLPIELKLRQTWYNLWSCSTGNYKHLHQYQLYRGFDPTTTEFTRHLKYGVMFQSVPDDLDRFTEVQEEPQQNDSHPDLYTRTTTTTGGRSATTSQSPRNNRSSNKCGSSKASSSSKKKARGKRTAAAPKKNASRPKRKPTKTTASAPSIGCSDSAIDPPPSELSSSRHAALSPVHFHPLPHSYEALEPSAGVPETGTGTSAKQGKRKRDSVSPSETIGRNETGKEDELGRGKRRRVAVVRT
ncbi:hypothetical protein PM082_009261 [Marasmius tenuissimus]|nr:hypothetical protein PM082_009261 [Marasmius tenuissimus]